MTGRLAEALRAAEAGAESAQRTAEPFFVGMSQIQLAAARLAGGDAAGAQPNWHCWTPSRVAYS